MKIFLASFPAIMVAAQMFLATGAVGQSGLSPDDAERLLARLEALRRQVEESQSGRLAVAVRSFRDGLSSGDKAVALYVQCIERVRFQDTGRSPSDFRDWQRQNRARLGDEGFKTALRVQLRWLLLCLDAAENEEGGDDEEGLDADEQQARAVARGRVASRLMLDIGAQWSTLQEHQALLRENVFQTVFARAYDLSDRSVTGVAAAPLPAATVYDTMILPPLRDPTRLSALRAAWSARIEQEAREFLSTGEGRGASRDTRNADRWRAEVLPELRWRAEMDILQHGGGRESAQQLLSMVEDNLRHRRAMEWAEELKFTLQSPGSRGTGSAAGSGSQAVSPARGEAE